MKCLMRRMPSIVYQNLRHKSFVLKRSFLVDLNKKYFCFMVKFNGGQILCVGLLPPRTIRMFSPAQTNVSIYVHTKLQKAVRTVWSDRLMRTS